MKYALFLSVLVLTIYGAIWYQDDARAAPICRTSPIPTHVCKVIKAQAPRAGVPPRWAKDPALAELLRHESGFEFEAQNPTSTAYGLFQFLNTTWRSVHCEYSKRRSHAYQAFCGLLYVKERYHTPARAWRFWRAHHWY